MRMLVLALLLLPLAACNGFQKQTPPGPVDVVHLPPMSGQEQALMISADSALASGDTERAERSYLDAVARSQGHVEAHLALASLYLHEGKTQQAGEILGKAAQLQPNNPVVDHMLGKIAIAQDRPADALGDFNRGLVSTPGDLDLLNGAGVASDVLHRHRAAQLFYQRALALHPAIAQPTTKTNLAMSYILDGQSKAAIALLKDEAKKPAATPQLRDNLALAYGLEGRTVEARKLTAGHMTEDERLASLARVHAYIAAEQAPAPRQPIGPAPAPHQPVAAPPSVFGIGR
ncbi:MAG: tetratricopeptide repeat protein [Alphaproteobacteria bacterium]